MLTGTFLKRQREKIGLNRTETANILGIASHTLQNWERSFSTPNSTSLRKLRKLYEFDLEEYLGCYRERLIKEAEKKVNLLKWRMR